MVKNIFSILVLVGFILAIGSADSTSGLESNVEQNDSRNAADLSVGRNHHGHLHAKKVRKKATSADIYDLAHDFENTKKSPETIQKILTTIAGDAPPTPWEQIQIQNNYRLTQIVIHIQNLEEFFEILHLYTPPDQDEPADQTTFYSNLIQQADEQNIGASIVVPTTILKSETMKPIIDSNTKVNFGFSLEPDKYARQFSLRKPKGIFQANGAATSASFDPTSQLDTSTSPFNQSTDGQFDVQYMGKTWSTSIIPRFTDIDTLTLEIEIREVSSLVSYRYVLVYEPQ